MPAVTLGMSLYSSDGADYMQSRVQNTRHTGETHNPLWDVWPGGGASSQVLWTQRRGQPDMGRALSWERASALFL